MIMTALSVPFEDFSHDLWIQVQPNVLWVRAVQLANGFMLELKDGHFTKFNARQIFPLYIIYYVIVKAR